MQNKKALLINITIMLVIVSIQAFIPRSGAKSQFSPLLTNHIKITPDPYPSPPAQLLEHYSYPLPDSRIEATSMATEAKDAAPYPPIVTVEPPQQSELAIKTYLPLVLVPLS